MVDTQQIRDEFASRLNKILDDVPGIRIGRGRNVDLHHALSLRGCKASKQATHKWLNAESMPEKDNMRLLADLCLVRAEWLEYGDGEKQLDTEEMLGKILSAPPKKSRIHSVIWEARRLKNLRLGEEAELFGVSASKLGSWAKDGVSIDEIELFERFEESVDCAHSELLASGGSGAGVIEEIGEYLALERLDISDDLLKARAIRQRVNAIIEFKCEGNPEKLAELTGLGFEQLDPIISGQGSIQQMVNAAQDMEISLRLTEGALTETDPNAPPSIAFNRYIFTDLEATDRNIRCIADALNAVRQISGAIQAGAIERKHVQMLQAIVKTLPEWSEQKPSLNARVRTSRDEDKDKLEKPRPPLWF